MARPFIYIGSAMLISLLIFSYCGIYFTAAVFVMCAIAMTPLFLARNRHKAAKILFTVVSAVIISASLFTIKSFTEYIPSQALCTDSKTSVSGTLTEHSQKNGYHFYTLKNITCNDFATDYSIKIMSFIGTDAQIDDTMVFTVSEIESISDSSYEMTNKADGVYLSGFDAASFDKSENITIIRAEKHSASFYLDKIRNHITSSLGNQLKTESAVVDAMLTGNTSDLDNSIRLNFNNSGISHLFAVSGFHLTIWATAVYLSLSQLPFRNRKIIQSVVTIVFIIFFMALTGFTKSVVRAGIMHIIMYSGGFVKHRSDTLNSLFLALTAILFFNPFAATSISLQMSFAATLGIIILGKTLTEPLAGLKKHIRIKFLHNIVYAAVTTAALSLTASLVTMLITAANFGYYSFAAPVANILCLPVTQLIMPVGLLIVICESFTAVSHPLVILCRTAVKYILTVTDYIAHTKWSVVNVTENHIIAILAVLTVILILAMMFFSRKKIMLRRATAFVTACFVAVSAFLLFEEYNTQKITVCDVGEGISVIYSSKGRSFVLGCGGNSKSSYTFHEEVNNIKQNRIDLLLVPRNTDIASSNVYTAINRHNWKNVILSDDDYDLPVLLLNKQPTEYADEKNIIIDENTNLLYINNDSFSGVRIESDDLKCTIIFKPNSDFSVVPSQWQTGDLLITARLTGTYDTSGFDNIIVSSDKTTYDSDLIRCTGNEGTIIYSTTLTGGGKIYAALR